MEENRIKLEGRKRRLYLGLVETPWQHECTNSTESMRVTAPSHQAFQQRGGRA